MADKNCTLPRRNWQKTAPIIQKKQFRDQLTHHDNTVKDNNCVICKKKGKKTAIKECVYHALWQCDKIKDLYENVAKELGTDKYTTFPQPNK